MRTWLLSLSDEECYRLLSESRLGRMAVIYEGRPEIFPVVYSFDLANRTVSFPTFDGTKLHGALGWPTVAFEVDGMEDGEERGWSVVVHGRAELVVDEAETKRLASSRSVAWRNEPTVRWLRITPDRVSGRRILAAPE